MATIRRSDGRDQAGLRMQVGQLDADRRRLEQPASIVELDHRDTAERVAADVVSGLAVLTRHDSQLVGHADLLEHPQHTGGAAAGYVIHAHHPEAAKARPAMISPTRSWRGMR
ncbi:MAG TPA: hypothetical protein VNV42_16100 [Solirubrobacteraceae bacterium]|nr:hypothetical protein [Solirubrobacteraceae bacterium]